MKLAVAQNEITAQYILPERVVLSENAQNADALLNEYPRQVFWRELPLCTLKKNGFIVLDFGCEFQGGADIVVQSAENSKTRLRLTFGESVSEALSSIGEKNATNDHSPRDYTIDIKSMSHIESGNTGYRFLKLEAQCGEISLSSVQGISRFRDLEYLGAFECSDERLNEIWRVGARTVHLNMQEYLWDGIKRDRLVWVGDMHPEAATISMVFGDTEVVRKSLDFARDNTVLNGFMNGFASYSMWWIKIQRDLYWDSGNFEYLKCQEHDLVLTLENILTHIDEAGVCDIEEKFVEWSSRNTPDEEAAFYAMLVAGLTAGAELLGILCSFSGLAKRCRTTADKIKARKYELFGNKQTAAMVGLSGLADLKQMCETIIKPGGAEGLSAFWGYYVLLALAELGETDFALDIIREYWGAMLDLGATAFWEDFDIKWAENSYRIDELPQKGKNDAHGDFGRFCYAQLRHSLCHGWVSGPTSFLSRHVLGIKPIEPGYKKIKIEPHLGKLSYAEGKIPTPYGVIRVRYERNDKGVKTDISVPDGIELIT